jgi:hypothetical protein
VSEREGDLLRGGRDGAADGKQTNGADIQVLNKEESKQIMKTKEFENFINKTSKIVERALNTNIDILGSFFDDNSDETSKNMGTSKGDKITA